MNQNFSTGAELALKAFGIHDARQRQAMMEKLYASQLETEGLRETVEWFRNH